MPSSNAREDRGHRQRHVDEEPVAGELVRIHAHQPRCDDNRPETTTRRQRRCRPDPTPGAATPACPGQPRLDREQEQPRRPEDRVRMRVAIGRPHLRQVAWPERPRRERQQAQRRDPQPEREAVQAQPWPRHTATGRYPMPASGHRRPPQDIPGQLTPGFAGNPALSAPGSPPRPCRLRCRWRSAHGRRRVP